MNSNPKLRPDVIVRRIALTEDAYVIVKDPNGQKYFKFEDWEYDLLMLLDGTRDAGEVAAAYRAKHPTREMDAQGVVDYVEGLRQIDLIQRSIQQRHLAMMDQLKTFRKKRFYDAEKSTLFQIHIPLFDPDKFMDRVMPWIRWWWSPWFVIPWLVIFIGVMGFLLYHWQIYWAGFWALLDVTQKSVFDWILLLVLIFATSMWHELGHGLTCKRFGGEVHSIGIMIFYLEPAFYCGIDDSYLFTRRSHRVYVAFGGAYFELVLCSVALAAWLLTPAEWWLHEFSLIVVLLTGLSLVLFNLNPLIKLDGYYVLMDMLDVPNLREESFDYIGKQLKRYLFHLDVSRDPISRRRRRIYLVYGILSILYTATILFVLYIYLEYYLVGWFGPIGYLILLGLIALAFRRRTRDAMRFLKHLWLDKRDLIRTWPGAAAASGLVLLIVALLTLPRTATRIEARFSAEPGARAVIRAPAEGVVRQVSVAEGAAVVEGEIVAILESPEIAAARDRAASDLSRARREVAWAHRSGDVALERQRARAAREAETRLAVLDRKLERMALASPLPGVVSTSYMEETIGSHLDEGEELCTVDNLDTVRLVVAVSEMEIEEIVEGTPVRMLAASYPGRTIASKVLSIAPVAQPPSLTGEEVPDIVPWANLVRVEVEVENDEGLLRPGMTGRAQFLTQPRSLAGKAWWRFHRWAGSVFW